MKTVLSFRLTNSGIIAIGGIFTLVLAVCLLLLNLNYAKTFAANLSWNWVTNTNGYTMTQREAYIDQLPDEIKSRIYAGHAYAIRHEDTISGAYCSGAVADSIDATITINFNSNTAMGGSVSEGSVWRYSNTSGACPAVSPTVGTFTAPSSITYVTAGTLSFVHCGGSNCQNRGMFLGGVSEITYAEYPSLDSGFPRPEASEVLQHLYPPPPPPDTGGGTPLEEFATGLAIQFTGIAISGYLSYLIIRQFRWRGTS